MGKSPEGIQFINNKDWRDNLYVTFGTRNPFLALLPVNRNIPPPSYYYQ